MWKNNECKKFKPNIFNKNKCANCYRDREQHSDEALEVNKATRIVSKCGYLFVAPNWDFTNPVYRTKRWQRRWFVLYDDGELTYSVDDHYDTIPQAVINLNNVFEITEADAITGNENSIAIVANDGIHFCKGTCKEESQMWLDILRLFPTATVMGPGRATGNGGRAKRSATFPGIRIMSPASRFANNKAALSAMTNKNAEGNEVEDAAEDGDVGDGMADKEEDNKIVVKEKPPQTPVFPKSSILRRPSGSSRKFRENTRINNEEQQQQPPPPTPPNSSPPASPLAKAKRTTNPVAARPPPSPSATTSTPVSKTSTASITLNSSSSNTSSMPSTTSSSSLTSVATPPYSRRASYHKPTLSSEYRRFSNDHDAAIARRRPSSSGSSNATPSRGSSSYLGLAALQSRNSSSQLVLSKKDSISSTESLSPSPSESRGTPDGCGLDLVNSSPELLTKKGWLMKQGLTKEWHKYWFVLQDVALLYYRDPKAESKGFLDGIIDLSLVQHVEKTELPRNFGFSVHTFEGKSIIFSAITDGIRNNWITSLRKAANLPSTSSDDSSSAGSSGSGISPKPPLTKRSSSFSDSPMTITTTKIVRSSTTNVLIPPKVPMASKALTIPKLTTTPSSSNEQEDEDESSEYDDEDSEEEEDEDEDSAPEDDHVDDPPEQLTSCQIGNDNNITTTNNPNGTPCSSNNKNNNNTADINNLEDHSSSSNNKSFSTRDGVIVDLLETEVDSLKAKLELTQSELFSIHNSNLDLTTQLRQQTQAQIQSSPNASSSTNISKKYSFTTANSSQNTSVSTSSANGTKSSPVYDRNAYVAEELSRTQKELSKQSSEILALKNQLGLNQISLQQKIQSLDDMTRDRDDAISKLDKANLRLDEANVKLAKKEDELESASAQFQDLSNSLKQTKDSMEKEVSKWKMLYESLYLQYDNELHGWEDSLTKLEKQRDEREVAFGEETRRKERVVSDLSEQLKESEDRIQELQVELEAIKDTNEELKHHNEESFSRLVVTMEEKFEETLRAEKEKMELAFKLKAKEHHDLYDHLAGSQSPMSTRANSRRASLVKISSMRDLLALKAPTLESLDAMEINELKQKFIVLMDHFHAAVEEIRALRNRLSKAQDTIDAMEIDKIRFEESFKRTIVMQEQQENLMSKRIQDLTNKLLVSEKAVRQLKERKHSRKHSLARQQATQSDSGAADA